MLILLSRAANGNRMSHTCAAFVNQNVEADTVRDLLAAKVNTDDFSRRDGARSRTIPLGAE